MRKLLLLLLLLLLLGGEGKRVFMLFKACIYAV